MKEYKQIPVYSAQVVGISAVVKLFTCRGRAADATRALGYESKSWIQESMLNYVDSLPEDGTRFYAKLQLKPIRFTNFYPTEAESIQAAEEGCILPVDIIAGKTYYAYQMGILDTTEIAPLPTSFEVRFRRKKEGGFYTQVNVHPEFDGEMNRGKLFFPDRQFKDVSEGPAMVHITKDCGSYGFLDGVML